MTDISQREGAKEGISDRVEEGVGVAMAKQAIFEGDFDAAEDEFPSLHEEMDVLAASIMDGKTPRDLREDERTASHADWTEAFLKKYPDYAPEKLAGVRDQDSRAALRNELDRIIEEEIGLVFAKVLEHCAVFADTEEGHIQFEHFAGTV